MTVTTVVAFLAVAALTYVTPGPDWFVVMRHAVSSRRQGFVAAVGVQCGLMVHMTAASVGVAALLLASAKAFTALKLVGAAYLVYLGVRSLLEARRTARASASLASDEPQAATPAGQVFRQSMLSNVLNPKAALFFVAVLPQFLSSGGSVAGQVIVLGLLDVGLGLVWWTVFVLAIRRITALLGGTRSRVVLGRVSGVALVGLGSALAFTGRARAA
jgi:threonine/homoserine/homoserine lactone efflux protein